VTDSDSSGHVPEPDPILGRVSVIFFGFGPGFRFATGSPRLPGSTCCADAVRAADDKHPTGPERPDMPVRMSPDRAEA
jgi:hypothetical protein